MHPGQGRHARLQGHAPHQSGLLAIPRSADFARDPETAMMVSETLSKECPMPPHVVLVAKVIERSINAHRPRIRYTVAPSAKLSIAMRKALGARGWDLA